jgi:hypothetical protein
VGPLGESVGPSVAKVRESDVKTSTYKIASPPMLVKDR